VDNWPGMVVLAVTAKYWTEKTHVAITAGPRALEEYTAQCSSDILAIVEKVRAVRVPTTPLVLPFSGYLGV
jgi:dynein heavy chain